MNRHWNVWMAHVFRESNRVADSLANLGHSMSLGLHVFNSPPNYCRAFLNEDARGVSLPRRILVS